MSERKGTTRQQGGFPKAYNPHLKRNLKLKKPQEDKKINQEAEILEPKEKKSHVIRDKEYFAKQLIENGYIDSYIDFFYLGWKKTPNIKKKYTEKKSEDDDEEQKLDENYEEETIEEDINIPRHDYSLDNLEGFFKKLIEAEDALRK